MVLTGLIWLVIPMAWTYLNDRVFYAHQMTWMTFRLQCVTTSLSTVAALVAATLDPSLTAFALSLGQALAYVVGAGVGFYVLRRRHGNLGLRTTGLIYLKLPSRRCSPPWPCPGRSTPSCPTSARRAGCGAWSVVRSCSASPASSSSP